MYKSYYIICVNSYEIDGTYIQLGKVEWKPKECMPIINNDWEIATDKEIDEWLYRTGDFDMRTVSKNN